MSVFTILYNNLMRLNPLSLLVKNKNEDKKSISLKPPEITGLWTLITIVVRIFKIEVDLNLAGNSLVVLIERRLWCGYD